jgi:sugar lactone lactonase YvrE
MHMVRTANVVSSAVNFANRKTRQSRRSRAWILLAGAIAAVGLVVGGQARTALAAPGDVSTVVGNGTSESSFNYPTSVTADSSGNIYFGDFLSTEDLQNAVYRLSPASKITRLAGFDVTNILHTAAAVAVDLNGDLLIADGNRILRRNSAGVLSVFAGTGVIGALDGPANSATFYRPEGLAVDTNGNVYVADTSNNKVRKVTGAGVVSTLPGAYSHPEGVAVDVIGNVYVADTWNHSIRKITPAGTVLTLAGSGSSGAVDGNGAGASFSNPSGIAVDSSGTVFVADPGNSKIRKITPGGLVSTLAGTGQAGPDDGPVAIARFDGLKDVAVDSQGNLLIAEASRIRKITPQGIVETVTRPLKQPIGVAVDTAGNRYFADTENHRIRRLSTDGVLSTLAGTGVAGSADGPNGVGSLSSPMGVGIASSGDVFVADTGNNRIRRITPAGVLSTFAGTGAPAPGGLATYFFPTGIAVDSGNNVFVSEPAANKIHKITPAGISSVFAGTGAVGFSDGPGTAATFSFPRSVAASGGDVFVADTGNHRIRKITAAGIVSTVAGTGGIGFANGPSALSEFNSPGGIAADASGTVYVSDTNNHVIRRISGGNVSTLAGNPSPGYADGPAASAFFSQPNGLAVRGTDLFVADTGNSFVRRVEIAPPPVALGTDVFVPVTVSRLLDTRVAGSGGPVLVGATRNLTVTGVGGVPANATAVALNVAAVAPPGAGHLRVFPAGESLPNASVLNFAAGKNTPNHVIVKVGAGGQISMYAGNTTQVIVDVNGYFVNGSGGGAGAKYVPVSSRTRLTTVVIPGAVPGNPAASSTSVVVTGAGGIPSGAVTVAVDIAAVNPAGAGHLRVFPTGSPLPNASTHNFAAGDTRMNLVLVNPGAGGAITIYNASAGAVTVTVDTVGAFENGPGLWFKPVTPVRPLDTRTDGGAPLAPGAFVDAPIRGFGVVPDSTLVTAVVVNVAAVNPSASGSVDIGPSLLTPTLPWFTHPANENVANLAIIPVGSDGKIRLVNNSAGTTHLIVDITGYFTSPPPA